jgi:hypothetical protein
MKNYSHNVIRVRKGKPNMSKVYWFVSILNKKKQNSQKIRNKIGFYRFGKYPLLSIDGYILGISLNKGVILNESAKKYLYLNFSYNNK